MNTGTTRALLAITDTETERIDIDGIAQDHVLPDENDDIDRRGIGAADMSVLRIDTHAIRTDPTTMMTRGESGNAVRRIPIDIEADIEIENGIRIARAAQSHARRGKSRMSRKAEQLHR